jgi:hypothetical protein
MLNSKLLESFDKDKIKCTDCGEYYDKKLICCTDCLLKEVNRQTIETFRTILEKRKMTSKLDTFNKN